MYTAADTPDHQPFESCLLHFIVCSVGCGLEVTGKFLAYSGGVYSEKLHRPPMINHEVSLF